MTTIAVLGGGQLGRMLGGAGIPLGVRFRFLDPVAGAPASAVGPLVVGALDDERAIAEVVDGATVVTYEWEGVPAPAARFADERVRVLPAPNALDVSQDRLREKELFGAVGVATAPFRPVDSAADLRRAAAELGYPSILKTRRGGYDGKGQVRLDDDSQLDAAWAVIGARPSILEAVVAFDRELSVLSVRGHDGDTRHWPLVENHHVDGILRTSRAPAPDLTAALQDAAEDLARRVLDHLDYVGVLAIELFCVGGALLANEMAPRVHNSGHWTIEGAVTSQFENHLRAVLGWPLGSTAARGHSVMLNVIGVMPDRAVVLAIDGAHLHDYGKTARPGRKLGHVTIVDIDPASVEARVTAARALLEPA